MPRKFKIILFLAACMALSAPGYLFADRNTARIFKSYGRESGLFAVIGCGDENAPKMAAELGANGNSLVHAIASGADELAAFNRVIAGENVRGCVTAEHIDLSKLPYRDYMVNVLVIMDKAKAQAAGLKMTDVRRCLAPFGRLVICEKGKVKEIEEIPANPKMDVWTHRYYKADGIPHSRDSVFNLPVGYRWNAGLPMNFDSLERSANRYSSTRALLVDDGCVITFNESVVENLGDTWKSEFGTDQYLTCRDAFNGRLIWRKNVGDLYYGGLYIENLAPMVIEGGKVYLPTAEGNMQALETGTGRLVKEFNTAYVPGFIAAAEGIVVVATWKDGKQMGSVKRFDRRRMDWAVSLGTIEAYDDRSGKLLWKNDLLGTSLAIADGRVYIANRSEPDPMEENHNRPTLKKKDDEGNEVEVRIKRPSQKVIAMDLKSGKVLWAKADEEFQGAGNQIGIEAAGSGAVSVARAGKGNVILLNGSDGSKLEGEALKKVEQNFFRYRQHVCTPVMRVNDIQLTNRGGSINKPDMNTRFAGARAACLTGTIPAYGSGYIAQNWCNCSPAQIAGLLSVGPIGRLPAPEAMEAAAAPVVSGKYSAGDATPDSGWSMFRANHDRSSSAKCDVSTEASVVWNKKIVASDEKEGLLKRDWLSYLNDRLTASVVSGKIAIVGDIDHNEIIAVNSETGDVVWHHMLAARVDTSPTVYKGICLVGDHSGYVTALKVKDGSVIYKLRIAPEEKRMVSYGKVESVWPVVGGVMVHDGAAYASAGRSQGSDGGLLVRKFKPETGEQIWASALPQEGHGVQVSKPTRNDAVFVSGDQVMVMRHRMAISDGEIQRDIEEDTRNEALKIKEKELGRRLNRKEKNEALKAANEQIKGMKITPSIRMGNEGMYSWNWTRLGHRKFLDLAYQGVRGDLIAWSEDSEACISRNHDFRFTCKTDGEGRRKSNVAMKLPVDRQVTSLVVCNNLVLVGGRFVDSEEKGGFVQAFEYGNKDAVWDYKFDAALAFNGLAVAEGRVIASFDDGTVACIR